VLQNSTVRTTSYQGDSPNASDLCLDDTQWEKGMMVENFLFISANHLIYNRGTLLVAQLVEALRYKSEGRGFDSRSYHWNFSLT
jgi:hypothetical protein